MAESKDGRKERRKGISDSPARGRKGSLQDQLEDLRAAEPRFRKPSTHSHADSGSGNFDSDARSWYKGDAEVHTPVDSSPTGKSQEPHQPHHHRANPKEKDMNTETKRDPAQDSAFKAMADEIGKGLNKDEAILEALRRGADFQDRMRAAAEAAAGPQAGPGERAGAAADAAAGKAAEEIKGFMPRVKKFWNDYKAPLCVMGGVAATVGVEAAVAAYKERQGNPTMRVGDTTVAWSGAPGTNMGMDGAGQGGNQPGAQPGNDNGAGNAGGGARGRGR